MKISLWMVANQLVNTDIELHINEPESMRYKSVRLKPAAGCIVLEEDKEDVLLFGAGENNYIRLKNTCIEHALEDIQNIFDSYSEWDEMLDQCIQTFNYQRIIDESRDIFRNPMLLLDSDSKLLAMSSHIDNINQEWKHLAEFGYISVTNYNQFKELLKQQESDPDALPLYIVAPPTPDKASFLTQAIRHHNIVYGRFTILEYGRKITHGDFQNVQHMCSVIAKNMFKLDREDKKASTYSNILKMIQGETVSQEGIDRFLAYMDWGKNDRYRICVIKLFDNDDAKSTLPLIREYLRNYLPLCPAYVVDKYIVLLFNENKQLYKNCIDGIKKTYLSRLDCLFGASLQFIGLQNMRVYVNQAVYAITSGLKKKPDARFFMFYKHALDYILETCSIEEKIYACHPDIVELWRKGQGDDNQVLDTLKEFLCCERSLLKASKNLYIHRNTLLYRMKQIIENMTASIEEPYTREYILTSIRILHLFGSTAQYGGDSI